MRLISDPPYSFWKTQELAGRKSKGQENLLPDDCPDTPPVRVSTGRFRMRNAGLPPTGTARRHLDV
jgi:hypothetical protein